MGFGVDRCRIHHEGTKGTKGFRSREGSLDPDNTNNLVVAPLPDALGVPSCLRALCASVVKYPAELGYDTPPTGPFNSSAD